MLCDQHFLVHAWFVQHCVLKRAICMVHESLNYVICMDVNVSMYMCEAAHVILECCLLTHDLKDTCTISLYKQESHHRRRRRRRHRRHHHHHSKRHCLLCRR